MSSEKLSVVSDQYMDAFMKFYEAVQKSRKFKKREQIERRLELAVRKAFREQGRQFVRGLSKFKDRFGEAAQIVSMFGDDFSLTLSPSPAERGEHDLNEALVPTEWMFVFHLVTQKTAASFEKPIDAAVQTSLLQGANAIIADAGLGIRFDLKNPRAVKYLDQYGAQQVKKINDTTRDYLQTIIKQATDEGWTYNRTAEAIIERYKEFEIGKPQEHIDSRAHLIAITETGNANLEGQMIVAQDLQDAGVEMEKAWSTVGDGKVSDGCKENEEQGWIGLTQPFKSGHQRPLRFPGCRCDLLTRVKH